MALRPPSHALEEKFSYLKRVLGPVEMCVKFRFPSFSSFRDVRGSQFTLKGAAPSACSLAKKFHTWKEYLALSKCVYNFNFLFLIVPEILRGSHILGWGVICSLKLPHFGVKVHALLGVDRGGSLIVH